MGKVRLVPLRMRPAYARAPLLACAAIVCLVAACDHPAPGFYLAYAEIVAEEDARGGIGLERIREHLGSDEPVLRALAVRALGRLEDPAQLELIDHLLDDADGAVREAAAAAMAQAVFGADPGPVARTLAARIEVEADPAVLGGLANNLGRLAFRTLAERAEAEATLVAAARRLPPPESDPALAARVGLARGIEAFARSGRAAPDTGEDGSALSPALAGVATALSTGLRGAAAAQVRRLAAAALLHGNQLGTEAARTLLRDEDWGVRRQVIMAATRHGTDAERAVPAGLADPDPRVRVEALAAYDRRLRPSRGCSAIIAAMTDPDPHVAATAIGLAARPCPDLDAQRQALSARIATLNDPDTDWRGPSRALQALAAIAPDDVRDEIAAFAAHPDAFVRVWAARAAAEARSEAVLAELAGDPVPNVREAALRGLGTVVGDGAVAGTRTAARNIYLAQLGAADPQLVMTATRLLAEHPERDGRAATDAAAPALLAALARFSARQRETERDVRLALLERIGTLGGFARDDLTPYLTDFDPVVAGRAAALLTETTGETHQAAPRRLPRTPTPGTERLRELERSTVVLRLADLGDIVIALRPDLAAANADRFARLAAAGYFDGLTFHRVEPNFVIQGGSPNANEFSGDGPYSRDEISSQPHWRGTVGLSTRGRDTGDGQIFVNLADNPRLDFNYTIFGVVVEGMEVVDAVQEGTVIERAEVVPR